MIENDRWTTPKKKQEIVENRIDFFSFLSNLFCYFIVTEKKIMANTKTHIKQTGRCTSIFLVGGRSTTVKKKTDRSFVWYFLYDNNDDDQIRIRIWTNKSLNIHSSLFHCVCMCVQSVMIDLCVCLSVWWTTNLMEWSLKSEKENEKI